MTLRFTPFAEARFLGVIAYLLDENRSAAWAFRDRALASLSRLLEFPSSGRAIPEFSRLPYREVIVRPYRFFYRVVGDAVWVVDVWHDAQLPDEPSDEPNAELREKTQPP